MTDESTEPQELSLSFLSECYEISQKATREALKDYDVSEIDKDALHLETLQLKTSLVYKLFVMGDFATKRLIATTRVNIKKKSASVKINGLTKKEPL